jgi:hypothetical protein
MSPRFPFPSAPAAGQASTPQRGPDDWGTWLSEAPTASTSNACCCPAKPAVRVIMPPSPARPHATELLLCAHHYRVSRAALAAAKAIVRELPGTPRDIAAWIGVEQADAPARVG